MFKDQTGVEYWNFCHNTYDSFPWQTTTQSSSGNEPFVGIIISTVFIVSSIYHLSLLHCSLIQSYVVAVLTLLDYQIYLYHLISNVCLVASYRIYLGKLCLCIGFGIGCTFSQRYSSYSSHQDRTVNLRSQNHLCLLILPKPFCLHM